MDLAPYDERVMLRCGGGVTIGQRAAFFGPDGSWADDYATPVTPDGWLPLPNIVEEGEAIGGRSTPIALFDFVVQEIRSASEDAPIPWDLLKDSPVSVGDATELAFLLDVHVAMIQEIDRKYWAWVAENR